MLELLGIPYTGNSPLTLALARDKALAQRLLEGYGLPVVKSVAVGNGDSIGNGMGEGGLEGLAEGALNEFTPPLFVKLRFEDASHGITSENFCADAAEARRRAADLSREFQQPCLIQEFLPGREFLAGCDSRRPTATSLRDRLAASGSGGQGYSLASPNGWRNRPIFEGLR